MAKTTAERVREMRAKQKEEADYQKYLELAARYGEPPPPTPAQILKAIDDYENGGMPYEELIHTPEFKVLEEAQHNADLLKSIRAAMRGAGSPYERMKAVSYLIDLSDKADAFQDEE